MSESDIENINTTSSYKNWKDNYLGIFAFYYFVEGMITAIPFFGFMTYITAMYGEIDLYLWGIIAAIQTLPWTIKFFIGLVNDNFNIKRSRWVVGFGFFGIIWWFILAFLEIPIDPNNQLPTYLFFGFFALMMEIGCAFSDTSVDALILEITPPEKMNKIQAYTLGMLSVGLGFGGGAAACFTMTHEVPIFQMMYDVAYLIIPFEDPSSYGYLITGIMGVTSYLLIFRIKEPSTKKTPIKGNGRELLSIVTKAKNWRLFLFIFFAAFTGSLIFEYFKLLSIVSLGEVSITDAKLSLMGESAGSFAFWQMFFYFFNGLGSFFGSVVAGKTGNKKLSDTLAKTYKIYIFSVFFSGIPFLFFMGAQFTRFSLLWFIICVISLVIYLVIGIVAGAAGIFGSTVKGEVARHDYPRLKATFYAFLVSFSNLGLTIGTYVGALLIKIFNFPEFIFNYLIASTLSIILLILGFKFFKTIDPKKYELRELVETKENTINLKKEDTVNTIDQEIESMEN